MKTFTPHLLSSLVLSGLLLFGTFNSVFAQEVGSAFASEAIDPGLVVSDVKKATEFYTQAIGFKEVKGFTVPGDWTKDVGLTDGKSLNIHVLVLGEGKNAAKLKLMEVSGANARKPDNQYLTTQQGIRYLTIQVTDIDEAVTRLTKAGVKPETKGGIIALPEGLPKGIYLTLVRDPDGNMIELVGPRKQ